MNIDENIIIGTTEWFNENFPGRSEQDKKMEIGDCSVENPLTILLYGNGLTMRYHPGFSNNSIINNAIHFVDINYNRPGNEKLITLFDLLGRETFEDILYKLNVSAEVVQITDNYNPNNYSSTLNEWYDVASNVIQISILEMIDKYDPNKNPEIANFIINFDRVFSLCYDPFVYWSLIDHQNISNDRFGDLFERIDNVCVYPHKYKPYMESQLGRTILYNLHGSMWHYLERVSNKYCKAIYDHKKVISNLKADFLKSENDRLQLTKCVLGGDSNYKIDQISNNNYLKDCYNQFSTLLFSEIPKKVLVLGACLSTKDKHIADLIKNCKNTDLYITFVDNAISNEYHSINSFVKYSHQARNSKCNFVKIEKNSGLPCDILLQPDQP
jgi:Domain of unknown function (DUF4917)